MSSDFITDNRNSQRSSRAARFTRGITKRIHPRVPVVFNAATWLGFAPDLPEHIFGARAWVEGTVGLHAAYDEPGTLSGGVGLSIDSGFKKVDGSNNPLGPAGDSTKPITRLQTLLQTNTRGAVGGEYVLTLLAMVGGDATATSTVAVGSGEMWRLDATETWVEANYQANVIYASGAHAMSGHIDGQSFSPSMPHSATFAAGSSSHNPSLSVGSGTDTTLGLPVMIFTNNIDPVYVFPATGEDGAVGEHNYTELHAGDLEPFYARTCFGWKGRMFYGGTSEREGNAQVYHHQRIRWSALFDASPDPANPGSGYIDIRELNGYLLRFENLDPYLVAYFSDGIVFFERTGYAAAPISYRVVTDHRGLLGGHAVSHISPREHLLVCTDGFFILNASGEFTEIGVLREGTSFFRKWHNYFFNIVDLGAAHRIQCHYDQLNRRVCITVPVESTGKNTIWCYDIQRDWMALQGWSEQDAEVTCFANHNATIRAGIRWDGVDAPTTWEDLTALGGDTWDSGSVLFGRSNLYHATATGLVHQHDKDITTFNGKEQEWSLVTARQSVRDVRTHTCWEGFHVQIADLGNTGDMLMELYVQDMLGNEISATNSVAMSNVGDSTGFLKLLYHFTRISGGYARFVLSGSRAVSIQQIIADVRETESRVRNE